MRILYLVSLFPCWSETFIVREIIEMIRLGVDVRIVSLKHPSESLIQSDVAGLLGRVSYPESWWRSLVAVVGAVVCRPGQELGELLRIGRQLRRHPRSLAKTLVVWWRTLGLLPQVQALAPSHIHAHWATYPSTAAMLISRRLGIPFSFTAHAHDIFLEDHMLAEKISSAAFTVAISDYNRRYLQAHVAGAARASMEIVHCGIPLSDFPFEAKGRNPQHILAVGRLDEIKGFRHLIDACALLRARGLPFHCDIIGSGPLESDLARQIENLGLGDCVRLAGARKQEEVRSFLYRAGVFALPSVVTSRGDRDGIPVALMEAMASGIPVVSTSVSGIPELIEDGVTGLLARPADAEDLAACLALLLDNRKLGRQLANQARARIEGEFNIQTEARKLHDAIATHEC